MPFNRFAKSPTQKRPNAVIKNYLQKLLAKARLRNCNLSALFSPQIRSVEEMETVIWALEQRVMMDAAPFDVELAAENVEVDLDQLDSTAAEFDESNLPSQLVQELAFEDAVTDPTLAANDLLVADLENSTLQLVVVDQTVDDYQTLIDSIVANAQPGVLYDFVFIDSDQSGVDAVNNRLATNEFDAIHIISHGSDGQLNLGSDRLSSNSLNAYQDRLQVWNDRLAEDADVFIYGCNVASTSAGESFVEALAVATGADVAASDDLTGAADLDGDWDLEYAAGQIETEQLFLHQLPDKWHQLLDATTLGESGNTTDSIAVDANGNRIIAFTETDAGSGDGSGNGVFVVLQSRDGNTVGGPIQVNQHTTGDQQSANVDADANGNFAVTWTSDAQANAENQVYVRLFSADGTPLTNEILVSDATDNAFVGQESTIAMNSSGEFVVVWEGNTSDDNNGVFAQRFNADGTKVGSIFLADTDTSGAQHNASVSMNDAGNFVIAWQETNRIQFQTFDSNGDRIASDDIRISGLLGHEDPAVSMNESGDFAVSFTYGLAIDKGIRAQVFDLSGVAQTGVVVVSAGGGDGMQINSDVLIGDDGRFQVVYQGKGTEDNNGIYTRAFDAAGNPLTDITLVNSHTTGDQIAPSIDGNSITQFVVSFSGEGDSGTGLLSATVWNNVAPTGANTALSVAEGASIGISESHLNYSDADGNLLEKIVIDSLPVKGTLLLDSVAVVAGQEISVDDIRSNKLTFEPGNGDFGDAFASFNFRVNDGQDFAVSASTITFNVNPQDLLWFSTEKKINNGPVELPSWEDGDALQLGGQDLQLGTTTNGELSKQFSLETFVSGRNIEAIHHVNTTVVVGASNPITLKPGDILFAVDNNTNLPGLGIVSKNDIVAFRPTSSDYSTGTFRLVLDGGAATNSTGVLPNDIGDAVAVPIGTEVFGVGEFSAFTLVEKDTMVGDTLVKAGNILFSDNSNDIFWMSIEDPAASSVTFTELIEGNDVGIGTKIDGIELVERSTTIGGTTLGGGSLLLSTEANDSVGSNNLNIDDKDVFSLNVSKTTLGSGTAVASAATFFTGTDAGLPNGSNADVDAVSLVGQHDPNVAPVIVDQSFSVDENSANGTSVGTVVASDSPGDRFTFDIVAGTGSSAFTIDKNTGQITVADTAQLDFEASSALTLTVQATDQDGLVGKGTVTINLNDLGSITGSIFEDTDGDSNFLEESIKIDGVDVRLYEDTNNNNTLDNGDQLLTTVVTSGGEYEFADVGDGDYFVVVDSKTVASSQTLLGAQTDVWAQQTAGSQGSLVHRGGSESTLAADGALYGGRHVGVSDDLSDLTTAQHVTAVEVAGANVTGVDSAFSFNVVTNVLGGDSQDDAAGNRSVQGSLRQFIQNANALDGDNAMRFVPVDGANMSNGGDNWWRVVVTEALPVLTDEGTTIDGRAFDANSPNLQLNTNSGSLGSGTAVGTNSTALNQVERPELEIVNDRASATVDNGLRLQASSITIQHIGIHGFGTNADSGNIKVDGIPGSKISDIHIQNNIIGSHISSVVDPAILGTDPLGAVENAANNIVIGQVDNASGNNSIQNNVIAFAGQAGVDLSNASNWLISDNEILNNGKSDNTSGGIEVRQGSSSVTIDGNQVSGHQGAAIDLDQSSGQHSIVNNTIDNNGSGGVETSGIRLFGNDNTISHNVISNHAGPGVIVTGQGSTAGSASTGNNISENTFANNGSVSIDLIESGSGLSENQSGDGHSVNDGGADANAGNQGIDYPVITAANHNGTSTTIAGTAAPNSRIEIYVATGDGVGTSHVVTTSTDATGNFSVAVNSLTASQSVTAILIDTATGNTSEFGQAFDVNVIPQVSDGNVAGLQNGTITLSVDDFNYSDPDGDPLTQIEFTVIPDHGELRLNGSTVLGVGDTVTKAQLDDGDVTFVPDGLEIGSPYTSFKFVASDGQGNSNVGQIDVTIVSAIPVFTSPTSFNIHENQTSVGAVSATDPQSGVTYSMGSSGDSSLFQIDPNTGALSFLAAPNFENPLDGAPADNTYEIQVVATDDASNAVTQNIQVNVTDINEAPVANDQNFRVDENTANGTSVGTVTSVEVDAGQTMAFNVVGGSGATAFAVNSTTGEITVADSSQLDFETTPSATLLVDITDNGTPPLTTRIEVTIDIDNVNEAPASGMQEFNLAENSVAGTIVGSVQAIDQDTGQSHSFSIVGGADAAAFDVDPNTGALRVVDPSVLDFETNGTILLDVRVTDNGTPPLSSAVQVQISLTNVNEAPTDITIDNAQVVENARNGKVIGTFSSTDQDGGDKHTYKLLNDADGRFTVDPVSGKLMVLNSDLLDYETSKVHSIVVQTTDAGGMTYSETVSITVQNVDEAPHVGIDTFSVDEGDRKVVSIASLLSNDTDPEKDAISFVQITKQPDNGTVVVQGGTIVYQHDGSETTSDRFRYQIVANGKFDTGLVVVTVNPVNDKPIAVNDTVAVANSDVIIIDRADLIGNDIDPDSPHLAIQIVEGPMNGSISLNADGDIVFVPTESVTNSESFKYRISDGSLVSNVAEVNIAVVGIVSTSEKELIEEEAPEENPAEEVDGAEFDASPQTNSTETEREAEDEFGLSSITKSGAASGDDASTSTGIAARSFDDAFKDTADLLRANSDRALKPTQSLLDDVITQTDTMKHLVNSSISEIETIAFASLFDQIDGTRDQIVNAENSDIGTVAIVAGFSGILTVGYVMWLAQSGFLMTGLISSIPSWQLLDPLRILEQSNIKDDSVEDMVNSDV